MQREDAYGTYELLFEFIMRIKQCWAEIAERNNLTMAQLHAVSLLMNGGMPMAQLSSLLSCDASYVTGIVDGLEKRGLARRHENSHDRRVKVLSLTEKGMALRHDLENHIADMQDQLLEHLTAEEREVFRRLLAKIIRTNPTVCGRVS